MKDYFMDIYSLPKIDYQEEISQGFPLGVKEFNSIVEKLYFILSTLDLDKDLLRIINISKSSLIGNLSNFLRLCIVSEKLENNFNIKYTYKNNFNVLAGKRNLGEGYISDFFEENTIPLIQPFLKGYFYNKRNEYIKKILSNFPIKTDAVIFNANKWVEDYLQEKKINYTKLYNTFFWKMSEDPNVNNRYNDSKELIDLIILLSKIIINEFDIKKSNKKNKLRKIIEIILSKTYTDYKNCQKYLSNKKINFSKIYSGTCGSYLTRIVFEVLKQKGIETNAFMHSGAISHMNYPFDPRIYIEYEIPDNFYLFNNNDLPVIQKRLDSFNLRTKLISMNIKGNKIVKETKKVNTKGCKNIIYIATTTPGGFQFFGVDDDMRKVSYENKLFELLKKHGYKVKYKTHPKGVKQNYELLLNKFSNIEILENKTVNEIINEDAIFIFKMVDSTAFNEIMKTDKAVIVVSENQEKLLSTEARITLKDRVSFVNFNYKNGLAQINEEELLYALECQYTINYNFVNRYQ